MTEPSNAELTLLTGLERRKVRESEGLFVAEGIRLVEELLGAGLPLRLAVVSPALEESERGRALATALAGRTTVRAVGRGRMNELAGTRTSQGVLAIAEAPRAGLEALPSAGEATVLVLDAVQDPGNLGTLARAAAGFGCAGLVCLTGTVDPWNPKAVRASAGALFRLPVVAVGAEPAVAWLQESGYVLLGADAAGEPVDSSPVPERAALVVGNEGAGLSPRVASACDRLVAVPMRGGMESLNVAVATGILLYVITRGRA